MNSSGCNKFFFQLKLSLNLFQIVFCCLLNGFSISFAIYWLVPLHVLMVVYNICLIIDDLNTFYNSVLYYIDVKCILYCLIKSLCWFKICIGMVLFLTLLYNVARSQPHKRTFCFVKRCVFHFCTFGNEQKFYAKGNGLSFGKLYLFWNDPIHKVNWGENPLNLYIKIKTHLDTAIY